MDIRLIKFENEHLRYLEHWEKEGELYKYLSHIRPRALREETEAEGDKVISHFYMVKYDGRIIGCVWLEEDDPHKREAKLGIYLGDDQHRGRGIGEQTLRLIMSKAFREMDLHKITLSVREKNQQAIACYKKCGFTVSKELPKQEFSDGSFQGTLEMVITKKKFVHNT